MHVGPWEEGVHMKGGGCLHVCDGMGVCARLRVVVMGSVCVLCMCVCFVCALCVLVCVCRVCVCLCVYGCG
jgi:hypothetical protein